MTSIKETDDEKEVRIHNEMKIRPIPNKRNQKKKTNLKKQNKEKYQMFQKIYDIIILSKIEFKKKLSMSRV